MDLKINQEQVGSWLKLNCFMIGPNINTAEATSRQFNVNCMVLVNLKFEFSNGYTTCFIKTQPHTEAKDFLIKLKVQFPGGYSEWICTHDGQYKQIVDICYMYMDTCCKLDNVRSVSFSITVSASKVSNGLPVKLYNDEEFTDFNLSSSEGSVPIHRSCLAARSNVFKNMLSREWKETKEGRIQIEGVTLQTLQDLKRYIYLGELPDDGLQSLLLVASCYMMEDLKTECVIKLAQTVKPKELYSIFKFAVDNELPELTFAIISGTSQEVVEEAKQIYMKKNDKKDNNEV